MYNQRKNMDLIEEFKYKDHCGVKFYISYMKFFMIVKNGSPYTNALMRHLNLTWTNDTTIYTISDWGIVQGYDSLESYFHNNISLINDELKKQLQEDHKHLTLKQPSQLTKLIL